tara:strand:- start:30155 stop:31759 length:1605 start_codon:yes stop_codon:yes gene_type:complete
MQAYIIQVVLFQLLFIVVYEVLLKKETFFSYNRGYLLLTPVLAFLIPFLKIELLGNVIPDETIGVMLPEVVLGNVISQSVDPGSAEINPAITTFNWWALIYFLGVFVSLFIFVKKYVSLSQMFKFQQIWIEKEFKIIEIPNSTIACTFFKTIFLGASLSAEEKQSIISHEQIHVKQRHSIDLLFFELLRIVFWFNPLVYIYQSHITGVHEFLADKEVVKHTEKKQYYQQLLNTAFNTQNISFINQFFSHSLIKKRIVMLQKSQSKTIAKFKYFVLVPLIMLMLTYTSATSQTTDFEINISNYSEEDQKLIKDYRNELQNMKANGASFFEIADVFMIDKDEHIKSKEAFYRFKVYIENMFNETNKKKDDKLYEISEKFQNQTYEDYVAYRKTQPIIEVVEVQDSKDFMDVPFAVVDQIPIFPGCEDVDGEGAMKDCVSKKIQEHVQKNFNTNLGKELGFTGVNRVIVQFKIDKNGDITSVRARAPHPELETEAIRVINTLPKMIPGKQKGKEVGVMYSLPIVFQVEKVKEVDEKN